MMQDFAIPQPSVLCAAVGTVETVETGTGGESAGLLWKSDARQTLLSSHPSSTFHDIGVNA